MSKLLAPFAAICDGPALETQRAICEVSEALSETFCRGEQADAETTARTESCGAVSVP